jgi:hypothetical protein
MAVTIDWYNPAFVSQLDGSVDWDTDTFKFALTDSTYSYLKTQDFFDDITNEISGTAYSAGGDTMTNILITQDDTNNRATLDFDDPEWLVSTITNARNGILYKSTGVAGTSPLVLRVNFGADFSSAGTTFRVELDAVGMFVLQAG